MTKDEALKLALEALKQIDEAMPFPVAKLAIMEAEKALAQPEQGYTTTRNSWTGKATHKCNVCGRDDFRSEHAAKFHECEALAQPEQHQDWCASLTQMLASMPPKPAPCNCKPEPVIDKSAATRIATSLGWEPKRAWVGLTDEEMNAALDYWSEDERSAYGGAHAADEEYVSMIDTWRYIEAKLKEKNT